MEWLFVVLGILLFLLIIVVLNIKIVPQSKAYVIERLGTYHATWETGLHVKIPFLERVAKVVSLKEQVADFPPQPVITKDNVTMQIDTVIFFQITDAKLYTYGVERPISAIENLTATTLRNSHRRDGARSYAHLPRYDQCENPRYPRRSDRPLGHQGQPRGAEEYRTACRDPGCDGEADEGRA